MTLTQTNLALFGGPRVVDAGNRDIFHWPIVTEDDEAAVLDVLRRGAMSGTEITKQFEQEFARWQGLQYALACNRQRQQHG